MNDQKSWDSVLVKKYSSSNHFKLLNQLRNEVKKYPLNNKKYALSVENQNNDLKKSRSNLSNSQNKSVSINSNKTSDFTEKKSNVSFNNARNFSIYKYNNNESTSPTEQVLSIDKKQSDDHPIIPTFTERLNQIDMK